MIGKAPRKVQMSLARPRHVDVEIGVPGSQLQRDRQRMRDLMELRVVQKADFHQVARVAKCTRKILHEGCPRRRVQTSAYFPAHK